MNDFQEQRQMAMIEIANRSVGNADRNISYNARLKSFDVCVDVIATPSEENLNYIKLGLEAASKVTLTKGNSLSDCDSFSNTIYISLVERFSDSQVKISVRYGNVGVTNIFNQSKTKGN
jgi:hypothetical protein